MSGYQGVRITDVVLISSESNRCGMVGVGLRELRNFLSSLRLEGCKITISRGGVLAHRRGFGTCGWTGTGR